MPSKAERMQAVDTILAELRAMISDGLDNSEYELADESAFELIHSSVVEYQDLDEARTIELYEAYSDELSAEVKNETN